MFMFKRTQCTTVITDLPQNWPMWLFLHLLQALFITDTILGTHKRVKVLAEYYMLINTHFQLCRYCDQLKLSESTHVLQPFLPSILEGLVQLAAQFSSEVLTLVMETLCIVCTVDPAFTTSAENKICPLTIAIFLKYNNGTDIAPLTTSSVILTFQNDFLSCFPWEDLHTL